MTNRDEFLGDRKRALEEQFFRQRERRLLEKARREADAKARRRSLSAASGISDETVLERLDALGLEADTVCALSLVPLVGVAWADGHLDAREEEAVLAAAAQCGLEPQSPGHELLRSWLDEAPGERLMATWKAYVKALAESLGSEELSALRSDLLGRARRVAEAAGGFLGLGKKVSAAEEKVLAELEEAFSG